MSSGNFIFFFVCVLYSLKFLWRWNSSEDPSNIFSATGVCVWESGASWLHCHSFSFFHLKSCCGSLKNKNEAGDWFIFLLERLKFNRLKKIMAHEITHTHTQRKHLKLHTSHRKKYIRKNVRWWRCFSSSAAAAALLPHHCLWVVSEPWKKNSPTGPLEPEHLCVETVAQQSDVTIICCHKQFD